MKLPVILTLFFFFLLLSSHLVNGKEKNAITLDQDEEKQTSTMNGKNSSDEFVTQPMYAIGSLSQSYENYQVYFFPEYDIPNFISAYNNLGGLPSLGVYSQTNCLFNVVWNGIQQESCQCGASSSPGSIQQVIAQNSALCHGSISDYVVEPVTTTSQTPGMAFYKSNLNPSCSTQCYLHGTCVNSVCKCSPGWSGSDCQTLITPRGYNASYFTILWTELRVPEFLTMKFENHPNCTIYLAQMPSGYDDPAHVQQFQFSTSEFSFDLYSSEERLTMSIIILYPAHASYCSGSVFTGNAETVVQMSSPGYLPQTVSNYFLLSLPEIN